MKRKEWTSPKLTKYQRNDIEVLGLKLNNGGELGTTVGPS